MPNTRFPGAVILVTLALLTPHTTHTSIQGGAPRPCSPGDVVHPIAPGLWSIEPPAGFDPRRATAAQLDCYGLSRRPGLHRLRYVTPRTLAEHGAPPAGSLIGRGNTSLNWTGYEVLSKDNHNDYFTQVEGAWTVPAVPDVFSSDGYRWVYVWVGLGGDELHNPQSRVLWQAGTVRIPHDCLRYTDSKKTGMARSCGRYAFWYDDYGCTPGGVAPCPNPQGTEPIFLTRPTVRAGDRVYVKVNGANGRVYVGNLTTGQAATMVVSIDNTDTGRSAEWIAEESGDCSYPSYLCSYRTIVDPSFSSAYAYGSTMSTYVDIFNYRRYDLVAANGTVLAQPPALNRATHGFSVTCCAF